MKISHQTLTLSQRRKDRDQVLTDPSHWIIKSSANYPDRSLLKQMVDMAGVGVGEREFLDGMGTAAIASLSGEARRIIVSFSFGVAVIRFISNF